MRRGAPSYDTAGQIPVARQERKAVRRSVSKFLFVDEFADCAVKGYGMSEVVSPDCVHLVKASTYMHSDSRYLSQVRRRHIWPEDTGLDMWPHQL